MSFNSHEPEPNGNGVLRFGELVEKTQTLVFGVREYTGYVWGKRIPRTNEARARAAWNDLEEQRARMGDPSPLMLHERFLTEVRVAVATVEAGKPEDRASMVDWFYDQVKDALVMHDQLVEQGVRPTGPEYQVFLNRLICSLVEGFSPLQADLLDPDEVRTILRALHYPGFWTKKDESDEADSGKVQMTETLPTTEESPTGSTSKQKLPV